MQLIYGTEGLDVEEVTELSAIRPEPASTSWPCCGIARRPFFED